MKERPKPQRVGRLCEAKPRTESVCVHQDWSHDGTGRPVRTCSPSDGVPASDGSATPHARDVHEEHHVYGLTDVSPEGRRVRMLVLRFGDHGFYVQPEGVPSGVPFRFRIEGDGLRLIPAPRGEYELEAVLEEDP